MCLIAKASREVFGSRNDGKGKGEGCHGRHGGIEGRMWEWYSRAEADSIRAIVDGGWECGVDCRIVVLLCFPELAIACHSPP